MNVLNEIMDIVNIHLEKESPWGWEWLLFGNIVGYQKAKFAGNRHGMQLFSENIEISLNGMKN